MPSKALIIFIAALSFGVVSSKPTVSRGKDSNGNVGYKYEVSHYPGLSRMHMNTGGASNNHQAPHNSYHDTKNHGEGGYIPRSPPPSEYRPNHYENSEKQPTGHSSHGPPEIIHEPQPEYPSPYDSASKNHYSDNDAYQGEGKPYLADDAYPSSIHTSSIPDDDERDAYVHHPSKDQHAPESYPGHYANGPVSQEHINPHVSQEHHGHPHISQEPINPQISQEYINPPVSQEYIDSPVSNEYDHPQVSQELVNPHIPQEPIYPPVSQEHINPHIPQEHVNPHIQQEHVNPHIPQEPINPHISQELVNPHISQEYVNSPVAQEHVNPHIPQEPIYAPVHQKQVNPHISQEYVDLPSSTKNAVPHIQQEPAQIPVEYSNSPIQQDYIDTPISQDSINPHISQEYSPSIKQEYSPSIKQEYSPSIKQEYSPSIKQEYTPPIKQEYAPSIKQEYSPSIKQEYAPSIKQEYSPSIKQEYSPSVKQEYSPSIKQEYSPSIKQAYAPPSKYVEPEPLEQVSVPVYDEPNKASEPVPVGPKYQFIPSGPPYVTNSHSTEIIHPPLPDSHNAGPVEGYAHNSPSFDEGKPASVSHAFRLPIQASSGPHIDQIAPEDHSPVPSLSHSTRLLIPSSGPSEDTDVADLLPKSQLDVKSPGSFQNIAGEPSPFAPFPQSADLSSLQIEAELAGNAPGSAEAFHHGPANHGQVGPVNHGSIGPANHGQVQPPISHAFRLNLPGVIPSLHLPPTPAANPVEEKVSSALDEASLASSVDAPQSPRISHAFRLSLPQNHK